MPGAGRRKEGNFEGKKKKEGEKERKKTWW